MKKNNSTIFLTTIITVCSALSACGGSSDSDTSASITTLSAGPSVLRVGEGSVLKVGLSFSAGDTFLDNDRVNIVVRLPAGLAFDEGSAEIDRPIDDENLAPTSINPCPDGSSFLSFSLNQQDLLLATNPTGNTDAEITMQINETSALGSVIVAAAAGVNGVAFSCSSQFSGDQTAAIVLQ